MRQSENEKERTFLIPGGTVLATGATVIGSIHDTAGGSSESHFLTVINAWGTGTNNDTWVIRHFSGANEAATLVTCTLNTVQTAKYGYSFVQDPWETLTDPIYHRPTGVGGPQAFEVRYTNNTGAPVTVPAEGYYLTLKYVTGRSG